uniref:Si:ch211-244b2.4 n=1 Tax=Poecilia reticulata TaxID=8081 RepID=A0A3P9MXV0_POERE
SEDSNESDFESESEQESDSEDDSQIYTKQPCKYYNRGGCKNGASCSYLHVCKYFLTGSCRYGSSCKLNHNPQLTDGRPYQWQINGGNGWKDVENDHIIEAQYSLPHTKSIKIYNTPYGAVCIDFIKIRVYGKNLKVRRLDDGNAVWNWYCTLSRKWRKYGDKVDGNPGPVKSSDIERKFQSNPKSSFTFTAGVETFQIKFPGDSKLWFCYFRAALLVGSFQTLSVGTKPQWQFEGKGGNWHSFKHRVSTSSDCSITSDDIESKYQLNPTDTMKFKINGQPYKLDFGAMIQINQTNNHKRKIRRVLV